MPVKYCFDCGAANTYSGSVPASCKKCKHSLSNPSSLKPKETVAAEPVKRKPILLPDEPVEGRRVRHIEPKAVKATRRKQVDDDYDDEDEEEVEFEGHYDFSENPLLDAQIEGLSSRRVNIKQLIGDQKPKPITRTASRETVEAQQRRVMAEMQNRGKNSSTEINI